MLGIYLGQLDQLEQLEIVVPVRSTELYRFVSRQFQLLFHWVSHPSFHLSLTVLVHYRSMGVFSLGAWSPQLHPRVCRLSGYSGISLGSLQVSLTRLSLPLVNYSKLFSYPPQIPCDSPTTPFDCSQGLGCSLFARRLLRESL